jgi:tetratricopeptide (TPR) repeat protein
MISPQASEFYLWRGNTYAKLEQDDNCVADYQKAIKLDPKLAVQYFAVPAEKRNASAQPATAVIGRRKFNSSEELAASGGSYVKKTTNSRAIELYKQAMDKSFPNGLPSDFTNNSQTPAIAAIPVDDTNKPPETISVKNISLRETTGKDKKRAVRAAKKIDENFDQVGHDKFKKDLEQYTEAIRMDSDNAANYYHRGRAHQYLKEYEQSLQDFSDAIRLSPQSSQFYLARASIYMLLKKPLLAKADVKSAQSVDPTVPTKVILDLEPPQP